MIKVVCFDLDNTLVDSELVILKSFDYVFLKHLKDERRDLFSYREFLGPTLKETFGKYINDEKQIEEMINDYIVYYKTIEMDIIKLFPNVLFTLKKLKEKGIKIVLITNKFYASALPSLTMLNIKDYFDDFICLDRQKEPKPSSFPLLLAKNDFSVRLDEMLMVGDNEVDIVCAKNADVKSVLVDWNAWSKETKKIKPDFIIKNMIDLIKIVENGG